MGSSMRGRAHVTRWMLPLICLCSVGGCGLLLGLDEFVDAPVGAGAGGGAGGSELGATGGAGGAGGEGGQPAGPEGGTAVWSSIHGDSNSQYSADVAVDGEGNIYVVGSFEGAIQFGQPMDVLVGAGGNDVFIVKLGPDGSHLWSRRFGDNAEQRPHAVAASQNGEVFIVGEFGGRINFGGAELQSSGQYDVFVAKLDSDGGHLWSRRYGSALSETARGVALDPATGDPLVVGWFGGSINFGVGSLTSAGGSDVFVVRLSSSNGSPVWFRGYGGASSEQATSVDVDPVGGVVVGGSFQGAFDFGSVSLMADGGTSAFVAKLSADGDPVWAKQAHGPAFSEVESLAVDFAGNVVVSGRFESSMTFGCGSMPSVDFEDIYLAKLDSLGNCTWSKRFGGPWYDYDTSVAVGPDGHVLLTGLFTATTPVGDETFITRGGLDTFLVKLDGGGGVQWARQIGSDQNDIPGGVAVSPASGAVSFAGSTHGTLDLGTGMLVSAGSADVLVATFAP